MIPIIISSGARSARLKAMHEFEEEKMTDYTPDDLGQDWEFKIVRSGTSAFRKPVVLQKLIEEESQSGWVMLEKFDDSRVRFKRPRSLRSSDTLRTSGIDPYRTQYGLSYENRTFIILVALLGMLVVFGIAFFMFFTIGGRGY